MTRLELTTAIAADPQRVFDISLDVETHTSSMADSSERVIGGVTSGRMNLGDSVTWQARHFGRHWQMTSVISAWDPPHSFVDEQTQGPFKRWHHTHRFTSDGNGGTLMSDIIDLAAPLGPLGRISEHLVLDRYMRNLMSVRNTHIRAKAETSS